MSVGRIVLLLIVVGVVAWLVRSSNLLGPSTPEAGSAAPGDRARAAAANAGGRNAQTEASSAAVDSGASGGAIHENMTPEQVRALLGPPDSVETESTDAGGSREKWTYSRPGKTVVFENGVVVRIE